MRKIPDHVSRHHPIVTGKYAIFTPAIDACAEILGVWVDKKVTGAYIYGPSRFGKTKAVQWFLKQLLEERLGVRIPLHIWIRPFTFSSPGEFYKSILDGVGHAYGNRRSGGSERLIILREFFIASAEKCDTNSVILIIDEAQGLTTNEWLWLLSLQNHLEREGFALGVFSVASHQMAYEFDLLSRTGNPHVAARFLVDQWRFPGVESEEELAFILEGYDEHSRWPKANGTSYLQYFAPKEYERGKRLALSAPLLWKAMVALLPADYSGYFSFPMKHIALAVEDVLVEVSLGADWEEMTDQERWVDSLTMHRLADHMRAISLDV